MSLAKKLENTESSLDKLAEYFYQIGNHEELFKIGKSLLQEVQKKGVKNFAFTSIGQENSQQRTILGLCCYIDQSTTNRVAVISDNLSSGVFKKLMDSSTLNSYSAGDGEDVIKYKSFYHHFDFIDYADLIKFYENHNYTKNFDSEISKILKNYDIVLWDIPAMENIKKNSHFHYRLSHFYESMTVIVSKNKSSGKQLEVLRNFYSNFNIQLNGVLFDTPVLKEQQSRRKILGVF